MLFGTIWALWCRFGASGGHSGTFWCFLVQFGLFGVTLVLLGAIWALFGGFLVQFGLFGVALVLLGAI